MIYFAGPIEIELPWPLTLLFLLITLAAIVIGVGIVITFVISVVKLRKNNISLNQNKPLQQSIVAEHSFSTTLQSPLSTSKMELNNYIWGLLVDTAIISSLVFVYFFLFYAGLWSTEKLVFTIQYVALGTMLLRILSRAFIGRTLGDWIVKAPRIESKYVLHFSLADVIVGGIVFIFPAIMSTSV